MHESRDHGKRRAISLVFVGALHAASLIATPALGSPERATATLDLAATFGLQWRFGNYCKPPVASGVECVRFLGTSAVPGLGVATVTYAKTLGEPICGEQPVLQFRRAMFVVAGKGSIQLAKDGPVCGPTAPADVALTGTVSSGEGLYAGASGSVRFASSVYNGNPACGPCGTASDRWTGTLTVPGLEFDTTAPVLSSVKNGACPEGREARARALLGHRSRHGQRRAGYRLQPTLGELVSDRPDERDLLRDRLERQHGDLTLHGHRQPGARVMRHADESRVRATVSARNGSNSP